MIKVLELGLKSPDCISQMP